MNQFPYLYPHSLSEVERLNEEELWQDNRDAEVSHTQLTEILVGVLSRGLIIHAIIVPSNSGNGTAVQELLQNKATGRLCGVLILCPVDKGKIVPRKIACV